MVLPAIPLWAKLGVLWVGKKALVYGAAKVYGIPRLYRKSQRAIRYFYKDKAARRAAFERVRAAYRLPNTVFSYFSQTPSKSQPSVGALRGLDITPIGGPTFASSHLMVGSGITQRAKVKLRNGAQSAVRALLPAFPYLSGHGSLLLRTAGLFPSRPGLSALQAVK